jgi:hypothetical protein
MMRKKTDSVIFSETQREILEIALKNPTLSNAEIADRTGNRLAFVRDTRSEYEDDVELAADVEDADNTIETATDIDLGGLSETQTAILELAVSNPTWTNSKIANETGARVALVRDTRDEYEDDVDFGDDVDGADGVDDTTSTDDANEAVGRENDDAETAPEELTQTQTEILMLASNNPNMSNAEIADETGARITLVRDTRNRYADDDWFVEATSNSDNWFVESTSEPSAMDPNAAAIDAERFSEIQQEILELALDDPQLTNGEIADETGARIANVRDTLREYEDNETTDDSSTDDSGTDDSAEATEASVDTPAAIDVDEFSEIQQRILTHHVNSPELTNREIAAETGARITTVRDTRIEYERDDEPEAETPESETDEPSASDDDLDSETDDTSGADDDRDDEIEMPETTAAAVFSETERAILETALQNPELTNSEIAAEIGARVTLVRDTRATYADAVDLAVEDEDEATEPAETTATETTAAPTFSTAQKEILRVAAENPDLPNAEIAAQTGARITNVRDTQLAYADADDIDLGNVDKPVEADEPVADTESTTDTESANENERTPTDDGESTHGPESTGPSPALVIAVLVGLLLLVAVLLS